MRIVIWTWEREERVRYMEKVTYYILPYVNDISRRFVWFRKSSLDSVST